MDPSRIKDDTAQWNRIPTKIDMNALLSTDISPDDDKNVKGEDK